MDELDHQSGAASAGDLLRVGVVLDERDTRRWHSTAVSEVERLGFCKVTVFTADARRGAGVFARVREMMRYALYGAYARADRRLFGRADDAVARVPVPRFDGAGTRPIAAIAAEDLDVVLCLAPGVRAEQLAGCARFGAWSLYAGGLRGRAGEAQLFPQMYDGDHVVPITLRAHTATDGERTICRSMVQSDQVSLHRGRCKAARRAARLPARALRHLHHRGWTAITSTPVGAGLRSTADPGRSRPTNAVMLRFLWRVAWGVLSRRLIYSLGEKQWFLAYRRVRPEPPGGGDPGPLTTIMPPAGHFYADPFLFQRDGRRFIFFEDFIASLGRAVICYLEIDEQGRHSAPKLALEQDCHLSYPFVFADGDDVYMLPETGGRRTVELYRAARFPDEWELERVLLRDVHATDATLLRHDGRLWLFMAIAADGDSATDELFLYSSSSLQGEWEPHPMNPLVSDVRSARPAGRIFSRNGDLIRPSQDCSRAYGWRLVFNRIDVLSGTDYREEPVGVIEPALDTGNLRTHSYDSDGTYEVVDGFRLRPKVPVAGCRRASREPGWNRIDLEPHGPE